MTESTCLSSDQVQELAGGGIRIIRYPDLDELKNWDELVNSPNQAAAVLFCVDSPESGHWIGAFNSDDGAHIFDPLGLALDSERKHISAEAREELDQQNPEFARLLETTDLKPHVSRVDFQENVPNVNTCGRWVALRIKNRLLTDADFAKRVFEASKAAGMDPDEWVVNKTNAKLNL